MPFPLPDAYTSASADAQRDERKRQASPPSSFYAQSQAILTAVAYFDPLHSGYAGAAGKHKNRMWSSLFVQLMAAFEFAMKDFIAQTLDATHIYDDNVKNWVWLQIDVPTVMATREGLVRLGAVLIHPLQGWQTPETLNSRYKNVYNREPVASSEIQSLRDLWIVRHSVAHNGGIVTPPDARRLRDTSLADQQVRIDFEYLGDATRFLREIVNRLSTLVGPSLIQKWVREAASRSWTSDQLDYSRIKLLTTCVESRARELPTVDEAMYDADIGAYGA
jgi:hypothetical protein